MTDRHERTNKVVDLPENEALDKFVEDGLLWLVNTALLHPRGYALGVQRNSATKEPVQLVLLGDGSEPWFFQPGEFDEVFRRYELGEERRTRAWFDQEVKDAHDDTA